MDKQIKEYGTSRYLLSKYARNILESPKQWLKRNPRQ